MYSESLKFVISFTRCQHLFDNAATLNNIYLKILSQFVVVITSRRFQISLKSVRYSYKVKEVQTHGIEAGTDNASIAA